MKSDKPSNSQSDWSPPQFDLKWIVLITVLCAIVAVVARDYPSDAIIPTILFLLLCWFVFGCVRLLALPKRRSDNGEDEEMSFEFDVYVAAMTEEQADEIAGRWPDTSSGARADQKYVGFKREAKSLGEAIDQAVADLQTLGVAPVKVEAEYPSEKGSV